MPACSSGMQYQANQSRNSAVMRMLMLHSPASKPPGASSDGKERELYL